MVKALEFIVIGARKAGTSSLFEHLRVHPDLYLPPAKDHPFFSEEAVYAEGWSKFVSRNFHEAPEAAQWGKVTHHYMYGCPGGRDRAVGGTARAAESAERIIPERIHAMFPDVKLIAILRDPVERCISDNGMRVLWGQQDRRSFDRTIADLLAPAALESSRCCHTHPFITWGEYGRILQPYYEVFPREQIFICFTDELSQAPLELMERVFRYLEVPSFVPPDLQTRFRQTTLSPRFGWLPSPLKMEQRLATSRGHVRFGSGCHQRSRNAFSYACGNCSIGSASGTCARATPSVSKRAGKR